MHKSQFFSECILSAYLLYLCAGLCAGLRVNGVGHGQPAAVYKVMQPTAGPSLDFQFLMLLGINH